MGVFKYGEQLVRGAVELHGGGKPKSGRLEKIHIDIVELEHAPGPRLQ
jgi:hypothetical protein